MTLDELKAELCTGDVILVHGSSPVQQAIEVATCSPFCHVAMFVKINGILLICEMVEGTGYQSMLFNEWLAARSGQEFYFGYAPRIVRRNWDRIIKSLEEYDDPEKRDYGYLELFKVWVSQFTGENYETKHEVCSLFVQHRWEIAGFKSPGCAAPRDFLRLCDCIAPIRL